MASFAGFMNACDIAARDGLPECYNGDVGEFLIDTFPDLPWNRAGYAAAVNDMRADPRWFPIAVAFATRFGVDLDGAVLEGIEA